MNAELILKVTDEVFGHSLQLGSTNTDNNILNLFTYSSHI